MNYCAITYNGYLLDELIEGYTTVNVENRGLNAPVLNVVDIAGRDGSFILNQKYPPKELRVHFLLKAPNNEIFLQRLRQLDHYLQTKNDVRFSFGDEQGVRFGRLSQVELPPYDQNQGVGIFTIYCQDPFLYSEIKTSTGTITSSTLSPVKLEMITATIPSNANKVTIINQTRGTRIILNHTFTTGQKLEVNQDIIELNNQNIKSALDYVESDYQTFKLHDQDIISISPTTSLTIEYRERL